MNVSTIKSEEEEEDSQGHPICNTAANRQLNNRVPIALLNSSFYSSLEDDNDKFSDCESDDLKFTHECSPTFVLMLKPSEIKNRLKIIVEKLETNIRNSPPEGRLTHDQVRNSQQQSIELLNSVISSLPRLDSTMKPNFPKLGDSNWRSWKFSMSNHLRYHDEWIENEGTHPLWTQIRTSADWNEAAKARNQKGYAAILNHCDEYASDFLRIHFDKLVVI